MEMVVCVKRVPMTQEVDLEINKTRKDIKRDALAYVINDWDNYAVEEAVLLKEKLGGTVTAVTMGPEDDEEVLRRALAMGADKAVRIDPGKGIPDSFVTAQILARVIKDLGSDLVLTGVQADDHNCGAVGIMLAECLDLAHAAVVTGVEVKEKVATVQIELEGGINEVSRIPLPAVLSIQSGINEPRYVSVMGIRRAGKKELRVMKTDDLNLASGELTPKTEVEALFLPPETEGAEMIEGDPSDVAEKIIRIFAEKGVTL
jgi:electron transfer flavoprotein beta subunit